MESRGLSPTYPSATDRRHARRCRQDRPARSFNMWITYRGWGTVAYPHLADNPLPSARCWRRRRDPARRRNDRSSPRNRNDAAETSSVRQRPPRSARASSTSAQIFARRRPRRTVRRTAERRAGATVYSRYPQCLPDPAGTDLRPRPEAIVADRIDRLSHHAAADGRFLIRCCPVAIRPAPTRHAHTDESAASTTSAPLPASTPGSDARPRFV